MRCWKWFVPAALFALLGLATFPAMGAEPAPPAAPAAAGDADAPQIPAEISDPAFDQTIDPLLLAAAFESRDAATLGEAAMQLAEAEKAAKRKHKALSSESLFRAAVKIAAQDGDKVALDALAELAGKSDNKVLAAAVDAAKKLAAGTRAAPQGFTITSEQLLTLDPTTLESFQALARDIQSAEAAGDKAALEGVVQALGEESAFLPAQRDYLKKLASDALAALPPQPVATAQLLGKLAGASRSSNVVAGAGTLAISTGGEVISIPPGTLLPPGAVAVGDVSNGITSPGTLAISIPPATPKPVRYDFKYTITNKTGSNVNVTLPSGKTYALKPNVKNNYFIKQTRTTPPTAKILTTKKIKLGFAGTVTIPFTATFRLSAGNFVIEKYGASLVLRKL